MLHSKGLGKYKLQFREDFSLLGPSSSASICLNPSPHLFSYLPVPLIYGSASVH